MHKVYHIAITDVGSAILPCTSVSGLVYDPEVAFDPDFSPAEEYFRDFFLPNTTVTVVCVSARGYEAFLKKAKEGNLKINFSYEVVGAVLKFTIIARQRRKFVQMLQNV